LLSLVSTGPAVGEVWGRDFSPGNRTAPGFAAQARRRSFFTQPGIPRATRVLHAYFRTEYGGVQNWVQFDLGIAALVLCVIALSVFLYPETPSAPFAHFTNKAEQRKTARPSRSRTNRKKSYSLRISKILVL